MKKVLIQLMTALVFLITSITSANAVDDSLNSVYVSKSLESKKIVLNLSNMMAYEVKCTILDELGRVIHRDKIITNNGVSQKYDLSRLETGNYTIIIDDLMKVEKINFSITNDGVIFDDSIAEITYKPTVWVNDDKTVDFNLLALKNDVQVEIKGEKEILYTERFNDMNVVSKRFNLADLPSGTYTMRIFSNGETFYRFLTI